MTPEQIESLLRLYERMSIVIDWLFRALPRPSYLADCYTGRLVLDELNRILILRTHRLPNVNENIHSCSVVSEMIHKTRKRDVKSQSLAVVSVAWRTVEKISSYRLFKSLFGYTDIVRKKLTSVPIETITHDLLEINPESMSPIARAYWYLGLMYVASTS